MNNCDMHEEESEPKIGFKTLPLDDKLVAEHLASTMQESRFFGSILLDNHSRRGRRHLKLHKDKMGYFVRTGFRGACKEYLGRCKVTFLNKEPTLFAFTLESVDKFDADQFRRWGEKYGITENG